MTRHFTPETENADFYDIAKKMMWPWNAAL
jgi:hypothetical protein